MILYLGQATGETLVEALHATLTDVCTASNRATPGVWRVHRGRGTWVLSEV